MKIFSRIVARVGRVRIKRAIAPYVIQDIPQNRVTEGYAK